MLYVNVQYVCMYVSYLPGGPGHTQHMILTVGTVPDRPRAVQHIPTYLPTYLCRDFFFATNAVCIVCIVCMYVRRYVCCCAGLMGRVSTTRVEQRVE